MPFGTSGWPAFLAFICVSMPWWGPALNPHPSMHPSTAVPAALRSGSLSLVMRCPASATRRHKGHGLTEPGLGNADAVMFVMDSRVDPAGGQIIRECIKAGKVGAALNLYESSSS